MNTLKTTDQAPPANDAGVPPAPPEAPATSVRVAGREVFIRSGYVKVKLTLFRGHLNLTDQGVP
ncbi:MAG: hypothetical protein KJZ96_03285, partial [Rhodocyclaceae bacterium]|nr:hypothetical protein [Rhodocyclaceae bacterium]